MIYILWPGIFYPLALAAIFSPNEMFSAEAEFHQRTCTVPTLSLRNGLEEIQAGRFRNLRNMLGCEVLFGLNPSSVASKCTRTRLESQTEPRPLFLMRGPVLTRYS